jgi:hypothetical protein
MKKVTVSEALENAKAVIVPYDDKRTSTIYSVSCEKPAFSVDVEADSKKDAIAKTIAHLNRVPEHMLPEGIIADPKRQG